MKKNNLVLKLPSRRASSTVWTRCLHLGMLRRWMIHCNKMHLFFWKVRLFLKTHRKRVTTEMKVVINNLRVSENAQVYKFLVDLGGVREDVWLSSICWHIGGKRLGSFKYTLMAKSGSVSLSMRNNGWTLNCCLYTGLKDSEVSCSKQMFENYPLWGSWQSYMRLHLDG